MSRMPLTSAMIISIHAPREGGDAVLPSQHHSPAISIHAPREGGDYYGAVARHI